jgi:hypothetical protein
VKPPVANLFPCCEPVTKNPLAGLSLGGAGSKPPIASMSLGGAEGSKPPLINMANFSKAMKKNVEGIIANKI